MEVVRDFGNVFLTVVCNLNKKNKKKTEYVRRIIYS